MGKVDEECDGVEWWRWFVLGESEGKGGWRNCGECVFVVGVVDEVGVEGIFDLVMKDVE